MNQVCRCCLSEYPTFTYNIFLENLQNELLLCVPSVHIEPDDGLPEVICDLCLLRMREALEFRRSCEENDRELRKRYEETSQAIEQALGLSILAGIGIADEQGIPDLSGIETGHADSTDATNIGVVKMLEEYTALEMTMLDELMLEDNNFNSCLADGSRSSYSINAAGDPIIDELLAKFFNDAVIEPTTEVTIPKKWDDPIEESQLNQFTPDLVVREIDRKEPKTKTTVRSKPIPKSLHPCPQCEKKFTRNFQLKLHLISVHGIGNGLQYVCPECNKTFASRHSLNYHRKALHSMERPFVCPHCQRRFVLRTQLASHLRTHTGQVKPRIHQCNECGKSWTTKSDLKTHMRTHDPRVERPFKCGHCAKSFYTQGHLSSHELVHTGEKPYRCALCERCYQNVGNLNNHIFRSHGEVLMGKQSEMGQH